MQARIADGFRIGRGISQETINILLQEDHCTCTRCSVSRLDFRKRLQEQQARSEAPAVAAAPRECVICMDRPRTVVFQHPNGVRHALCCADCAAQLEGGGLPCPTCRQPLGRMIEASQTIRETNYATRRAAAPPASAPPAAERVGGGHRATEISGSDLVFGSPRVELGRGSFGVVYRATLTFRGEQGAQVAVKELRTGGALLAQQARRARPLPVAGPIPPTPSHTSPHPAQTPPPHPSRAMYAQCHVAHPLPQELEMLLVEAATLASLRHPNVVGFVGVCLESSTEPMLVTEFVSGGSLERRLYPQGSAQALAPEERRRVAAGVAAGLVHIHAKSLVHRDLKPANVLLTGDLIAKVADVGLARALHGTQAYMSGTAAEGTPVYMAPEQWEEEPLTAKVDVYAFGVMLNEMETATRPWQGAGNMMAIGRKVCRGDRPPPAGGTIATLIARCWAAEPERRPTMAEVVIELSAMLFRYP